MFVLSVILARAGSRGLPNKCLRPLCGRVVVDYTFDHALESQHTSAIIFTTDCAEAAERGKSRSIEWVRRPPHLATDTATVDHAARHAVDEYERRHRARVDIVALLYANVPIRRRGLIDHAVRHLIETEADSVRTVTPVGKHHPDWMYRIDGDRMSQYRPNSLHRRQDLEPLYMLDGALIVVTRHALFAALDSPADRQAFLGSDRRAITVAPHDTVDIDEPLDLCLAEAILSMRSRTP